MNNTTQIIKELIKEVFSELIYMSNDELAFEFLESIRITELKELKYDFKSSVKDKLKHKLKYYVDKDSLYTDRQLHESFINSLLHKTQELLTIKIMNIDDSIYQNGMGEFLYEGYSFIEAGFLVTKQIFLEESLGKEFCLTGRIISKRVQKGKEEKYFAYLTIDDYNGLKLVILIPSKLYQNSGKDLESIENKSIGIMGRVKYNDFFKSNFLIASELEIPKGYFIDRKPL